MVVKDGGFVEQHSNLIICGVLWLIFVMIYEDLYGDLWQFMVVKDDHGS